MKDSNGNCATRNRGGARKCRRNTRSQRVSNGRWLHSRQFLLKTGPAQSADASDAKAADAAVAAPKPEQRACIERSSRTFCEEVLNTCIFEDFNQVLPSSVSCQVGYLPAPLEASVVAATLIGDFGLPIFRGANDRIPA